MAGFQFARIETYARTPSAMKGARRAAAGQKRAKGTGGWSARQVLAEALREPGACPHVAQVQVPVVLLGDLAGLASRVDELDRDPPPGQRKDTPVLLAGVLSAPWPPGDPRGNRWRADSVAWLRQKWGDNLQCVVAHEDESHDHMHFYVTSPDWGSVKRLHPGLHARKSAADEGEAGKGQKAAFTAAMQAFQDAYSAEVAVKHGMARLGPGRRRLTREAWRDEQQQAEVLADVSKRARQIAVNARKEIDTLNQRARALDERDRALDERARALDEREEKIALKFAALSQVEQDKVLNAHDQLRFAAEKAAKQAQQNSRLEGGGPQPSASKKPRL